MTLRLVRAPFVWTLAIACTLTLPLLAQWERHPTKNVPRTADGKVDLNASPGRTADGKVDLSGLWEPAGVKHLINIAADLKPGEVPLQPWAATLVQERIATSGRDHPGARWIVDTAQVHKHLETKIGFIAKLGAAGEQIARGDAIGELADRRLEPLELVFHALDDQRIQIAVFLRELPVLHSNTRLRRPFRERR
jgi:hypothetical protein